MASSPPSSACGCGSSAFVSYRCKPAWLLAQSTGQPLIARPKPSRPALFLGWAGGEGHGRALSVGDVKFTGQILPTNKLVTFRLDMKRVIMRRLVMGIADGKVLCDGEVVFEANDIRVGLFTPEGD